MARLLFLTAALILYGSLYPWQFQGRAGADSPLSILTHSWNGGSLRLFEMRDAIINIALYLPIGAFGFLTLQRNLNRWIPWVIPTLLGSALSLTVELLQVFELTRNTSLLDVYANTAGSIAGVALGKAFSRMSAAKSAGDPGAVLLLLSWAAYLGFPLLPVVAEFLLRTHVARYAVPKLAAPVEALSAFAIWYLAGFLMAEARLPRARVWVLLAALLSAVIGLTAGQALAHVLGTVVGAAIYALRPNAPGSWAGGIFFVAILLRGLAPFDFQRLLQAFVWIPFGGMLDQNWQRAAFILVEKLYFYGAAVWALRFAGIRLLFAAGLVSIALLAVEVAQIYLPGRTPEITDPLIAVLLAVALSAFSSEPHA